MVQKRQLVEEEHCVSSKHLKLEHGFEFVPCLEFARDDVPHKSDKDEGCFFKPVNEVDSGYISGEFTDLPVCNTKDVDCTLPGRLSTSSWASSTVTQEDVMSEAPIQSPDVYSYLLERAPLKQVPVGPEYQADIPEWCGDDEIKFLGSCVIPTVSDNDTVGRGRTDCNCENPGSHECVQQHIKKAREALKASIGLETILELGFDDMGEVVADKWTREDEEWFHEVVYSNPVSLGKNFWNHLAAEFPSRTSQEIVSYYFNVFVLRRRAEQNRYDPMNADSDDDEWQGIDRSEEEDDDMHKSDFNEHVNDLHPTKLHSNSFDSPSQPSKKTIVDESGDGDSDFPYDSCTSSDESNALGASKINVDNSKSWANHEFIFEPLDSRVWDVGFFSCRRTKTDFLSTGGMIDEVFGDESWDFEVTAVDKSSN